MSTQTIGEFLDSKEGQNILSIAGNVFLMRQEYTESARILSALGISPSLQDTMLSLQTGEGILKTPEGVIRLKVEIPQEWGAI